MPQYQNFYPQMSMNNQFGYQFQQPQPSYQDRFGMNSFNNQIQSIPGKVVTDFSTITANDVPMDGNSATFIKQDGTEIQLRAWQPDGTIATRRFKQVLEDNPINPTNEQQNSFYDDFKQFREDIFDRLDRLEKQKTTRAKKEVDADA